MKVLINLRKTIDTILKQEEAQKKENKFDKFMS